MAPLERTATKEILHVVVNRARLVTRQRTNNRCRLAALESCETQKHTEWQLN
jgi:hypothetical protein